MLDTGPLEKLTRSGLPVGKSKREFHSCGEGKVLAVTHKPEGWHFWCHRCNDKGWISHPEPSLAEKIERINRRKAEDVIAASLPSPPGPANTDPATWPAEAAVWLYKAGMSNDHIQMWGIYYCPRIERVVIPVKERGRVVYWQARSIHKPSPDNPKYINPSIDKPIARFGSGPVLCITEDILSAYKIGQAGYEAWCIMGTSIESKLSLIAATGKPVALCLDPDMGGVKGRIKLRKSLNMMGVKHHTPAFLKDPKYHSLQEIQSCVGLPTLR